MKTVGFVYYRNMERYYVALEEEQGFYFICSYKVRKGERAV